MDRPGKRPEMNANETPKPTTPASNVKQARSGVVHAGKWVRRFWGPGEWIQSQSCGTSRSQHAYPLPTSQPVTCKRCLAVTA